MTLFFYTGMPMNWEPVYLTMQLSLVTTVILVIIGIPISYWLTFGITKYRFVIETILNLPLVLPPSVLGFYLLLTFSPTGALGSFLESVFQFRIAFSFSGILIGSVIFSLPFMLQALQVGFSSVPRSYIESALVLGKSKLEILTRVILPNCKQAILGGAILSFAHTIGEFGVVLLIGGSIPGKTKVASIAIYEEVEAMNYANAHAYSAFLVVVSTIILLILFRFKRNVSLVVAQKS